MIQNIMAETKTGKTKRNRTSGFTIVETLVVVSIIIVFLAFGMVGILRYRDYLRITELDNMARSIYVAAQNRAVLLDNDRRFQTLVGKCDEITFTEESDSGKERRYIDSEDSDLDKKSVLDDLLPMGTIDPALRNGRFYIVYEPDSASVTDVFYVERQDYDLNNFKSGIVDALNDMGADNKRENRMTNKPVMVGWFGSNGAAGRDKKLPKPFVEVLIENGNELTLTVKYTMPTDLPADADVTCWANVILKYGSEEVGLLEMIPSKDSAVVSSPFFERLTEDTKSSNITAANKAAQTCTYTWVLDSLAEHVNSSGAKVPRQFKNIGGISGPGGDFTVTASLKLTADGYQDSIEVKAEDTDNSLFAADTHDGDIAYIANLRHLQNLDTAYSEVNSSIMKAEQIADIADAGTLKNNKGDEIKVEGNSKWEFKPIANENLLYYQDYRTKGEEAFEPFFIKKLNVTEASAVGKKGAGLFSEVTDNFKFQNVRLTESAVTGSEYTGGLIGYYNGSVEFTNCVAEDIKVTGSGEAAGGLAGSGGTVKLTECTVKGVDSTVEISGLNYAGGLVGQWADSAEFTNCGAEKFTVASSGKAAGGLAGSGGTVRLTDCTVKGDTGTAGITGHNYAGGMVGQWADAATFTRCSVEALSVESSAGSAGGLAGNGKTATFENCNIKGVIGETSTGITGLKHAGGLVGYWTETAMFTECHAEDLPVENTGSSVDSVGGAGGLAGSGNTATFENCTVKGVTGETSITGYNYAGGLAGYWTDSAEFISCDVEKLMVKNSDNGGYNYAGGLAGYWNEKGSAQFTYCKVKNLRVMSSAGSYGSAGGLAGGGYTAEFIGDIDKDGVNIADITDTEIIGSRYVGGMIGLILNPNLEKGSCFTNYRVVKTTVKSTGSVAGGLAGIDWTGGTIKFKNCSVEDSEVDGRTNSAGGLMGNKSAGEIEFVLCKVCKNDEPVTIIGGWSVGGLLGEAGTGATAKFTQCTVGMPESEAEDIKIGGPDDGNAGNAGGLAGCTMQLATFLECKVNNITISKTTYAGGLTGNSTGGLLSDCMVADTNVNGSEAGGLTGRTTGGTRFAGCGVKSIQVDGSSNVGGLAGGTVDAIFKSYVPEDSTDTAGIKKCTVKNVTVTSSQGYAGGLTGNSTNGSFIECEVDGANVTGSRAGGLTGSMQVDIAQDSIQFTSCKVVKATVTGMGATSEAGGLAGSTTGTKFKNCTVGEARDKDTEKNIIISADYYAGGLTGNSTGGSFTECKAVNAKVEGNLNVETNSDGYKTGSNVGGLTGRATSKGEDSPKFVSCTANGIDVKGGMNAGGLVGGMENAGFEDCISEEVEVSAIYYAGGLTGNAISGSFTGCKAVNASVSGDTKETGSEAGGLVGRTSDSTKFESCAVYWENDALSNLKNSDSSLKYQICATTAGGLAGSIRNGGEMKNSFAATLVRGNTYAGGLVGFVGKSEDAGTEVPPVSIRMSYADCYLQATESGTYAGGLIGIKDNGATLTLENVYAAGFIKKAENAAGLCGGDTPAQETTIQKAYAAMHYTTEAVGAIDPLSKNFTNGALCCFLKYNGSTDARGKTYTEMQTMTADVMGDGFRKLSDDTGEVDTHSYGLSTKASEEGTYPFLCLNALPHYGDWVKNFEAGINAIGEDIPKIDKTVSGNKIPAETKNPKSGGSGESQSRDKTVSGNATGGDTP